MADDGTPGGADPFLTRAAEMLKAVKAIAAADGLSEDEHERLRFQMDALEVPAEVREEVEAFDPAAASLDELLASFPKGGPEARNLLVAAIGVAVVDGYSAEEKQVTLCLEILNTRDDSHPMKGHPGYFGDDVELCFDLIRRVGSPRLKLLFDVYHVQVMNGDVIRRIRQYQDHIGHYHVAGNPGRAEPDDTQEINYPAVMRAILDTGYTGFVSQEFIPTWPDKLAALRYAVKVCDV